MSRFLVVKSQNHQPLADIINNFVDECRNSTDSLPEHGWRITYLDPENNRWNSLYSYQPLWKDKSYTKKIQKCKNIILHTQSTPNPRKRYTEEYIDSFYNDNYVFTFEGKLKLNKEAFRNGRSTSQKIWNTLKKYLSESNNIEDSLNRLMDMVQKNSNEFTAINIGLASKNKISALSSFRQNKFNLNYYTLYFYRDNYTSIICTNELTGYDFKKVPSSSLLIY